MEGGASNALLDFSGSTGVVVTTGDSPTWNSTAGHGGTGAFEFNGNDVLDAGAIFPTNSSYSQAAWVKTTTTSSYQNIISSSNDTFAHLLLVHNGYLECGHNELESLHDPEQMTAGAWYHVAVTFDYASGELILYKNGSPVASDTVDAGLRDMTHAGTWIGRYGGGSSWRGVIDDARVYAHVLSPEQIAAMYNGGSGNPNVIVSQETAAGEDWQCEATPFSAEEMGTTQFSNTVTIVASNDADGDGIPDDVEDGSGTCLSSTDDDSDDDGILDGNEDLNRNGVWDEAEGETNFCDADTRRIYNNDTTNVPNLDGYAEFNLNSNTNYLNLKEMSVNFRPADEYPGGKRARRKTRRKAGGRVRSSECRASGGGR